MMKELGRQQTTTGGAMEHKVSSIAITAHVDL
jgi:hypothetical protein